MQLNGVSIYILNYNGVALLKECLPSIRQAASSSKHPVNVIVIDNRSTDDSVQFLKREFPDMLVSVAPSNDFLCSFNGYVRKDSHDVVVLMNNDIKVEPDFLDPLMAIFESKEDAFMASSLCWDFSKERYEGGLSLLTEKWGMWGTTSVPPPSPRPDGEPYLTASIGACIAIRRDRFLELEGYDDLYLPGTLEDLDLCYRGWKKGWKGYFIPESVIYHKGQATFQPTFGSREIRRLAYRNTLFFIWKNISDPLLMVKHWVCLMPRFLYALLKGDHAFIRGFFAAISRLPRALRRRNRKKDDVVSDQELLKVFQTQFKTEVR